MLWEVGRPAARYTLSNESVTVMPLCLNARERVRFSGLTRLSVFAAVLFLSLSSIGATTNATVKTWTVYFGDLHTHCVASDGKGTPEEAYSYARDVAKVDFLALTDHNKAELDQHAVNKVIAASNAEQTKAFAPLVGQEFSTNKNGNHINVFGICEPIPETLNSDFRRLYRDWLPAYTNRHPGSPIFCQFNHPRSKTKDYGISSVTVKNVPIQNYDGDWDSFATDASKWVRLISLVNGPAQKTTTPPHGLHKDILPPLVNTWFFYLDKGMHLSPTCNHDTHVESWGDLSDGRTGVWLDEPLSQSAMMQALDKGRCFASEDKNLSLWFELAGVPMGTQLPDMGSTNLPIIVKVNDRDEHDSRYEVEVYHDIIGDGEIAKIITRGEVSAGGTYTRTLHHTRGVRELCLVHIKQIDTEDDAWSAPVYIGGTNSSAVARTSNPVVVFSPVKDEVVPDEIVTEKDENMIDGIIKFVSSKNSSVYHYPSCPVAHRIKPDNLITYTEAPEKLTLHKDCKRE
jgi:hypothetical protein